MTLLHSHVDHSYVKPPRTPVWLTAFAHFFLTSRPYSYASEISRAIIFCLLLGLTDGRVIAAASCQTLSLWLAFNWSSDRIQGDRGRIPAPFWLIALSLIVSLCVGYVACGTSSALFIGLYVMAAVAYAQKARSAILGLMSPILRGIIVVAQFGVVFGLAPQTLSYSTILAVLGLALWTSARNLLGDFRDMATDRYELPAQFGVRASQWALRFLFLLACGFIFLAGIPGAVGATAWILVCWMIVEIAFITIGAQQQAIWGYISHFLMIGMSVILHLIIGASLGLSAGVVLTLLLIFAALLPTYQMNPGKRYPSVHGLLNQWSQGGGISRLFWFLTFFR